MTDADRRMRLPAEALDRLFPFHLRFDRELRVLGLGPSLAKLLPALAAGQRADAWLRIDTPSLPFDFAAIERQTFTVFFLESLDRRFRFKGQMLRDGEGEDAPLLFLGSPVLRELGSLSGMGLTLKDFAIHDSAVDFLILLQTKTNTLNDVKNMAERLKKEVGERREAQKELQRINLGLEERVAERTREFEAANLQLQAEIREHSRAEERVREANARLKALVARLEEHNRQMLLLNTMGDMLQSCASLAETHRVIAETLEKLFPGESGSLALVDAADGRYRVVAAWGAEAGSLGQGFRRQDCWGLRRVRLHQGGCDAEDSICAHVRRHVPLADCQHVCVPLATRGELHGLLHLHGVPAGADEDGLPSTASDRRQLIHSAAEHISLAIANLKLREHLRQQTIRDALTGLYNRRHMEATLAQEIARADRAGGVCGVILLDVDHFKRFNDAHGHPAGDALLAGLGRFLADTVRGEDIACRYGGEEFMLILPGADGAASARRAEEIRRAVEQSLRVGFEGGELPAVTVSLGVACHPQHARGASALVAAADEALYRSKREGRNRASLSLPLVPGS